MFINLDKNHLAEWNNGVHAIAIFNLTVGCEAGKSETSCWFESLSRLSYLWQPLPARYLLPSASPLLKRPGSKPHQSRYHRPSRRCASRKKKKPCRPSNCSARCSCHRSAGPWRSATTTADVLPPVS